ncbi:MAG: hypothetical protein KatS3mg105_0028 [Gemmatales bacterium]|nr:MAG: hypothetical protein KatS3mg105_0028 [Gemmatales bacterium]
MYRRWICVFVLLVGSGSFISLAQPARIANFDSRPLPASSPNHPEYRHFRIVEPHWFETESALQVTTVEQQPAVAEAPPRTDDHAGVTALWLILLAGLCQGAAFFAGRLQRHSVRS